MVFLKQKKRGLELVWCKISMSFLPCPGEVGVCMHQHTNNLNRLLMHLPHNDAPRTKFTTWLKLMDANKLMQPPAHWQSNAQLAGRGSVSHCYSLTINYSAVVIRLEAPDLQTHSKEALWDPAVCEKH